MKTWDDAIAALKAEEKRLETHKEWNERQRSISFGRAAQFLTNNRDKPTRQDSIFESIGLSLDDFNDKGIDKLSKFFIGKPIQLSTPTKPTKKVPKSFSYSNVIDTYHPNLKPPTKKVKRNGTQSKAQDRKPKHVNGGVRRPRGKHSGKPGVLRVEGRTRGKGRRLASRRS